MSFLFLRSAHLISIFLEQRDFTTENDVECIRNIIRRLDKFAEKAKLHLLTNKIG